jgi:hypothetical protein
MRIAVPRAVWLSKTSGFKRRKEKIITDTVFSLLVFLFDVPTKHGALRVSPLLALDNCLGPQLTPELLVSHYPDKKQLFVGGAIHKFLANSIDYLQGKVEDGFFRNLIRTNHRKNPRWRQMRLEQPTRDKLRLELKLW